MPGVITVAIPAATDAWSPFLESSMATHALAGKPDFSSASSLTPGSCPRGYLTGGVSHPSGIGPLSEMISRWALQVI